MEIDLDLAGQVTVNLPSKNSIINVVNCINGIYILANAYDNQVKYLKTAKKPRKLSVDEWMQRIQNINLHLVNMEDGARMLNDRELIKEIIIPNLPMSIKCQLKMQ